jgi:hypothetical protein
MTDKRQQLGQDEEMQETEQRTSRKEPKTDTAQASSTDGGGEMGDRGEENAPLLEIGDANDLRQRWENLQAGFVDEPRPMVEQADELVGELMQQLTAGFADKRRELEAQWEKGEDVSTEDLRVALTRYRSFFNRLLSA